MSFYYHESHYSQQNDQNYSHNHSMISNGKNGIVYRTENDRIKDHYLTTHDEIMENVNKRLPYKLRPSSSTNYIEAPLSNNNFAIFKYPFFKAV